MLHLLYILIYVNSAIKYCISGTIGIEPIGMEADFIPDSSIDSSSILNVWHDKHFARANTQRNTARSWCAAVSDDRPYLQVDLAEISSICGVGTMGRGIPYGYHFGYPISYSVLLSNDSFNWTFVKGDDRTVSEYLQL